MIGMGFLRTPGGSTPDKNDRINTADIDGIRQYMCPISCGEPNYCINECKGFRTCRVGHRVAALLDEEANRKAPEWPFKGPLALVEDLATEEPKPHNSGTNGAAAIRKKARARCAAAVESGDPVKYLMEHDGLCETSARIDIRRWRKKYPDLFEGMNESPKSSKPTKQPEEDEISLEEFLSGLTLHSREAEPEEVKPAEEENPNRRLAELMRQEADLLMEIAARQEHVWRIREERKEIERIMSH